MSTLPPLTLVRATPAARAPRRARRLPGVLLAAAVLATGALLLAAAAGVRPHVEMSDSMRPALRAGDVVWLDEIAARDARRGDVVAFADPVRGAVVLHRVVRVRVAGGRLAFVTRGDANTGTERWTVERSGTLGRFTGIRVPHAGRAARALAGVPLMLVALASGLALAALALRRIWR
jgi:signal peptidase